MRIVFMGTPDFAARSLAALIGSRHEIPLVVTKKDKPVGRGHHLQASPVKQTALEAGIPVYQPAGVRTDEAFAELEKVHPDLIVVVAFGQIIPERILKLPKYGCVNVHASLLPKYRGAAPIQWAVLNDEKETGITIMQMDKGLDTGDILARKIVPITEEETGGTLFDKLADQGADLLPDTIDALESGKIVPEKQPEESPTPYARMIRKSDGLIDWTWSARRIECLVRGMNPWPSAYTSLSGKMIKIWKAEVTGEKEAGEPGTVTDVSKKGFSVITGDGTLRILELQAAGKKRMKANEFLMGHALRAGMRFE